METIAVLMCTRAADFWHRPSGLVMRPDSDTLMMMVRIFDLNFSVTEI